MSVLELDRTVTTAPVVERNDDVTDYLQALLSAMRAMSGTNPSFWKHYLHTSKFEIVWFEGTPVSALCGFTWLPSKNPDNHPLCPVCEVIYNGLGN